MAIHGNNCYLLGINDNQSEGTWRYNSDDSKIAFSLWSPGEPNSNQVTVVACQLVQLTQASFLQKNQTLQNRFLISVVLRWHRVSVACKNQSF